MIFILQFSSSHPLHSPSNASQPLLFTSFKFCSTLLSMLILLWTASVLTNTKEINFKRAVPQKKLWQTGSFAHCHAGNLLQSKKEPQNFHLTSWCNFENKEPQTNTKNTGFTNATTGRPHALMELCEAWILHAFCSFGCGWDIFDNAMV